MLLGEPPPRWRFAYFVDMGKAGRPQAKRPRLMQRLGYNIFPAIKIDSPMAQGQRLDNFNGIRDNITNRKDMRPYKGAVTNGKN